MDRNRQIRQDEYRARINRVIDYIESHIDQEISLEKLAEVACFSKYHFHRIFHGLMNETVFAFLQRLRVEKAATVLLANPKTTITQVTYDCGFSGPSAFARAFRERFGMSATQWRKARGSVYDRPAGSIPRPEDSREGGIEGRVTVRRMDEIHLAYIRYVGQYEGDAALFQSLYRQLFTWAGPRDLVGDHTRCIVVCHDSIDITDSNRLRLSAGITVPPGTRASPPVGTMTLSGGKYVRVRFSLAPDEYYRAWKWVYAVWLPESGYQPGDGPCFEDYPDVHKKGGAFGKTTVDICVPVVPL